MKKIKLAITGCMGRMGQQLIKTAVKDRSVKIVSLTENTLLNKKIYKGEKIADLYIKSTKKIKPINCPVKFNSSAIDEFLLIFLVAAKAKGVSYFKNLSELNVNDFKFTKIDIKTFSDKELKQIIFKEITSDEIDHVTEFDTDYQPDELSVIQYFTKKIANAHYSKN